MRCSPTRPSAPPQGDKYESLFAQMRELKLATVCEEAQCPNIGGWVGPVTLSRLSALRGTSRSQGSGLISCVLDTLRLPPTAWRCPMNSSNEAHQPTAPSATLRSPAPARRVLERFSGHRDHHAAGRHVHARVPLLRRRDVAQPAAARPRRADAHGARGGELERRLRGAHQASITGGVGRRGRHAATEQGDVLKGSSPGEHYRRGGEAEAPRRSRRTC